MSKKFSKVEALSPHMFCITRLFSNMWMSLVDKMDYCIFMSNKDETEGLLICVPIDLCHRTCGFLIAEY